MTRRGSALLAGLATAAAVAVLLRLSAWQWERATVHDSLRSYTYAAEWLVAAVALAVVALRRRDREAEPQDEAPRDARGRLVGPPLRPGERLPDPTGVRLRRWVARGR